MKKYTNGKRTIIATKKAFNVLYKDQGFREVTELEDQDIEKMNKEQLLELAEIKGLEVKSTMKKEEILNVIKEVISDDASEGGGDNGEEGDHQTDSGI